MNDAKGIFFILPETNIAHENQPFWWYLPGKMGILMGYVSFREGISDVCLLDELFQNLHRTYLMIVFN